jgi:hypothetical protein
MADYFTNFSLLVPLPNESAQGYAIMLAERASAAAQGHSLPTEFPPSLADVIEDWVFDTESRSTAGEWGVWLHSSSGGIDAVCAFIQHLLEKFDAARSVGFEWSSDCSKPREDAYGGGAAFITARKIKTMSTAEWLHKQAVGRARKP